MFLRKKNRDLHTTRSLEIPSVGTFMIAERTVEHSTLFKEDVEAVFNNNIELLNKVNYYLNNDDKKRTNCKKWKKRVNDLKLSNSYFLDFLKEIS